MVVVVLFMVSVLLGVSEIVWVVVCNVLLRLKWLMCVMIVLVYVCVLLGVLLSVFLMRVNFILGLLFVSWIVSVRLFFSDGYVGVSLSVW